MGPSKDTHGTLGPLRRKAVGGPINAPQGEVTHNDGALRHDNRQVLRQTGLVSEQDEISGLETIGWENRSWKYLSLIGDERVINLQRTKVYVFSDSVLCLGKIFETLNRTMHGNKDWDG